jgi:hypothetical protein
MAMDAPVIWPQGLPKADSELTAVHAAVDKETTVQEESAPTNVYAETIISGATSSKDLKRLMLLLSVPIEPPLFIKARWSRMLWWPSSILSKQFDPLHQHPGSISGAG